MSITPDKSKQIIGSKTNSIEIFVDDDGVVTFTDLPSELKEVVDLLSGVSVPQPLHEPGQQSPKWPDQRD